MVQIDTTISYYWKNFWLAAGAARSVQLEHALCHILVERFLGSDVHLHIVEVDHLLRRVLVRVVHCIHHAINTAYLLGEFDMLVHYWCDSNNGNYR